MYIVEMEKFNYLLRLDEFAEDYFDETTNVGNINNVTEKKRPRSEIDVGVK